MKPDNNPATDENEMKKEQYYFYMNEINTIFIFDSSQVTANILYLLKYNWRFFSVFTGEAPTSQQSATSSAVTSKFNSATHPQRHGLQKWCFFPSPRILEFS